MVPPPRSTLLLMSKILDTLKITSSSSASSVAELIIVSYRSTSPDFAPAMVASLFSFEMFIIDIDMSCAACAVSVVIASENPKIARLRNIFFIFI